MSISSAMFAGVSGLNTLGESMGVIGDNIANVNTIGFKCSRATFETALAQSISGASGTSQVGRGVNLSAVSPVFSQGSFESTNEPTDLAIGGKGFFMVRSPATGMFYTRAGNFRFDEEGYLVNPADLKVQGWILDPTSTQPQGAITDIKISLSSSAPNATSDIDITVNLDANAEILETPATIQSDPATTSGFVVVAGENDTIDFDDGGGAVTANLITDGNLIEGQVYTGAQMAAALEAALEAQGTNLYTVTYNNNTNTFSIQNDGADASTIAITGLANSILGLSTAAPTAIAAGSTATASEVAYNVSSQNDTFAVSVDGGEYVTVFLNWGAYTIEGLRTEIESQINAALVAAGQEATVDVRYDATNDLFQIYSSTPGTNSDIDFYDPTIDTIPADNFLKTINITDYSPDAVLRNGSTLPGYTESFPPTESGFIFSAGVNDVILFNDGVAGNVSLITQGGLTAGTVYNGDQVAAAIETALESPAGANAYTVSYDATIGRFTIQNDGVDASTITWTNAASTAAATLGFTQDDTIPAGGGNAISDAGVAFNILTGINDTLDIIVDDTNPPTKSAVSVTVPAGVYTGTSLAAALETAINSALSVAGDTAQVAVSYDDTNNRFRIASTTLGANSNLQLDPSGLQTLVQDTLMMDDNTVNFGQGFQVENPGDTSNYSTSLAVYDSLGNQHAITFYFRKSSDTSNASVWEWFGYLSGADSASGQPEVQARGTLTFNNNGILTNESAPQFLTSSGGFDFSGGAMAGQEVDISYGFGQGTNVSTQFGGSSSTIFQTQDGYGSGFLLTVSVDPDGVVSGHFSNGQILFLAKVALANFTNPWGLFKVGGNLWQESRQSGQPITGPPGTAGMGKIAPNSLEQSNVDLATEFVKMIINQRGFQANSRVITTTDDMLAELINLKR